MAKIARSPRAPLISLEDAVKKAKLIYDKEGKHSIPNELVAKHLGYSGANNGAALRTMGAIKSFTLLVGNNKGDLAASPDIETFLFTPDDNTKRQLMRKWLREPKIYAQLLDEYKEHLPSDAALRYRLIQLGFTPQTADDTAKTFKSSVTFARYYESTHREEAPELQDEVQPDSILPADEPHRRPQIPPASTNFPVSSGTLDRIPIRLGGGRRAYLEIPNPLFLADKKLIKRQIDLIYADDEEDDGLS